MISYLVLRSTNVSNTRSSLSLAPTKVSISQCPKHWRESTSLGRSSIEGPSTRLFSLCIGDSLRGFRDTLRSEEHTSELQSRFDLVCRLLLEKKKDKHN